MVDLYEDRIFLDYPLSNPSVAEVRESLLTWLDFFKDHFEMMIIGVREASTLTPITGLTPEELLQLPEMIRPLLERVGASSLSRGELGAAVQRTEHYIFALYLEEEDDEEQREVAEGRGRAG